jgi:hypothetical protein
MVKIYKGHSVMSVNPNPEKSQFARNFLANVFEVSQERGCQFARIM